MGVFLTYYDTLTIEAHGVEEPINHPLARRMTPIQRAGVGIFARAAKHSADKWAPMLAHRECDILFTSVYGEVGANHGVSHGAAHQRFPLSPKDFQHSLHNAAAGYLALTQGLEQNVMTLTHGYLSVDKAIHYAAHLLARNPVKHVVLVHANEYLWPDTPLLAKAEIFLFSREPGDPCTAATIACPNAMDAKAMNQTRRDEVYLMVRCEPMSHPPHDDCLVFREGEQSALGTPLVTYFDLPREREIYHRFVVDRDGDGIYSQWQRSRAG